MTTRLDDAPNEKLNRFARLKPPRALPVFNLRPFVYSALGLIFGILLYARIRFGTLKPTDFIPFLFLFLLSARSFSLKSTAAIFLCFFVFAGAGALLFHHYSNNFSSARPAGEYEVTGTVLSFSVDDKSSALILGDLKFDGEETGGKLSVTLPSEEPRTGDVISFNANVKTNPLPQGGSYGESLFVKDVRYNAAADSFTVTGKGNLLLRLNASVYRVFHENLDKTQADTAYALLTGNSGNMDESFTSAIRQGGVAHIFAVSGLHIGILYAAVSLVFSKCGRYKIIPATAAAIVYSAFCGFTVSSLRAVIMCAVMGAYNAFGRKYDFLQSVAFACCAVLLIRPAEWLSAGFRLSFGACLGLALFARPLGRLMKKFPAFLREYLSANLAVQIFTFPVLIETFGYFSVWGTLLNFILIPALPVLFLGLFCCTAFALIIPPAAFVFLAPPSGMLTLFALLFSFDFSLVLTGFSLGTSGTVFLVGAAALSEKINLKRKVRLSVALFFCVLFTALFLLENVVIAGSKITATKGAILVETTSGQVLVIDGKRTAEYYERFLSRNCPDTLDAVVVLGENANDGVSTALFLPAKEIHVFESAFTGLTKTNLHAEESFVVENMTFRYESAGKLTLISEDRTVEIDFKSGESLNADLFISGEREEIYYLWDGAVYRI